MVTTTTEPHVMLQQPVVVTSNKVNASPQVLKAAPGGQGKKFGGKGKGVKPPDKGKKNAVKPSTSDAVTYAGPSSNLRSKLHDKAKVTTVMIQELMEELQAIDQESLNDEQDSEATQKSDLEQEDSENCLTMTKNNEYSKCKICPHCFLNKMNLAFILEKLMSFLTNQRVCMKTM